MTSRPRPGRRTRIAVRVAAAAFALVLVELSCRFLVPLGEADYGFQGYTLWDRMTLRWDAARGTVTWSAYGDMRVSVTPRGYRRMPGVAPGPGDYRVACLGDSRTFGMWVDDADTWCHRLEALLEPALGRPVRSLNFGVMGSTAYIAEDSVIDDVVAARPDLVVIAYDGLNSSCRALEPEREYTAADRWLENALRASRAYQIAEAGFDALRLGLKGGERVPKVALDEYVEHLRAMEGRSRVAGAEVIFAVLFSPHPDVPGVFSRERYASYRRRTLTLAAETGARALDLEPVLVAAPSGEVFVENHIHLTRRGHERVAAAIASRFAEPIP